MLEIRPSCEHCDKDLPAHSTDAHICSYECTYCTKCVADVLLGVCPNCGGGFVPRPVRPSKEWRLGLSAKLQPASSKRKHKPVDVVEHQKFAADLRNIPAEER